MSRRKPVFQKSYLKAIQQRDQKRVRRPLKNIEGRKDIRLVGDDTSDSQSHYKILKQLIGTP